jgi:hypothetical protein
MSNRKQWENSDNNELALSEEEIQQIYEEKSKTDFLLFLQGLIIPSATGPQRFVSCMAGFQMDFFNAVAPSFVSVRNGTEPTCKRFWLERTKKSSKDSDIAACLMWLMAFPRRPVKCQVVASNSKQARIIEDRAVELLHYNPWLNKYVEIVQSQIRNKKTPKEVWVRIEATSSAGSAQGQTPDLLILNELVHVDKWAVMQAHMNNAAGVPRSVVIISTNAGIKGTPADGWRNTAINSKRWKVFIWNKLAPWISPEDIKEAKAQDPIGMEYARLWEGRWISGVGSALDEETLERRFVLKGPQRKPLEGTMYYGGLDLGISHDHCGIVILGASPVENKVRVAYFQAYKPSIMVGKKLEVDLIEVEEACKRLATIYNVGWFGYDPAAGGSFMAQRLRTFGVPMMEYTFSSQVNRTEMATTFVQSMQDGKLDCYDRDSMLHRDFGKFNIEHKPPSGYRLTAVSDEFGHADVGTALVIALTEAVKGLGCYFLGGNDPMSYDEPPLTEKQIKQLPREYKELWDMMENRRQDTYMD